jgi:hypothetical protein
MTPPPAVPAVATTWYDELSVAAPGDELRGYPLLVLLGGLGVAFGELHDIVRDTDTAPGWSSVLDPERCPAFALPWLAQFAGVQYPAGLTEAEQRDRITSPPAFERGTFAALQATARKHLTPGAVLTIRERDGSPYRITVLVRAGQIATSTAALTTALQAQKPAGLILTLLVTSGVTWDELTGTWDALTGTWDQLL